MAVPNYKEVKDLKIRLRVEYSDLISKKAEELNTLAMNNRDQMFKNFTNKEVFDRLKNSHSNSSNELINLFVTKISISKT